MRRFGVHLNALRAFEAAARLSSFSGAARELHVSHSTISHHIKGLEKSLGRALFLRQNRRVILTTEAESLHRILKHSFDNISSELEVLRIDGAKTPLKVTVTPSFASKWLVRKLRSFREVYPNIDVQVYPSLELNDFSHDGLDVGVRTGLGDWPGLRAEWLMPVHMTPLCAPSVFNGHKGSMKPQALQQFTLIHADVSHGTGIESEWREWLLAVGAGDVDCSPGLSFKDPSLALQAAIDGLGIAMGYVELAADDLSTGRLVQPFDVEVQHPWSYYIVIPEDSVDDRQTRLFCDWLRLEAASLTTISQYKAV